MWKLLSSFGSSLAAVSMIFVSTAMAQDNAETTPTQDVMLILDASGSMWGRIGETPKISIARTVIKDLLEDWDSSIEMGLMAYGHRRKGDCSDIEVLSPVGPVSKDGIMSTIKAINPKGKTPISKSVRQAAETLKYTEQKATVVLVSDGLETCSADPCALAKELAESGVDFTTHVIGFDLTTEEFETLQCLATETGGTFFNASNADELSDAMKTTFETTRKAGKVGIRLFGTACAICDPISDASFQSKVFATDEAGGKTDEQVGFSVTQGGFIPLEPGRYWVEGTISSRSALTQGKYIDVGEDGLTESSLDLNLGHLSVNAIPIVGGDPISKNLGYTFYSAENEDGKRSKLASSYDAQPQMYLPAGEVLVSVKHGSATQTEVVLLEAGERDQITVEMNIGYISASAIPSTGAQPLGGASFWINRDEPGASFDNKLDYQISKKPRFILAEGDYILTVQQNDAKTMARASVVSGETTEVQVNLNSGVLNVAGGYSEGTPVSGLFWRVYNENNRQIAISASNQAKFLLVQGTYKVVVQKGPQKFDKMVKVVEGESVDAFVLMTP